MQAVLSGYLQNTTREGNLTLQAWRAPTLASSSSIQEARLPAMAKDEPRHSHTASAARLRPAFLETPQFAAGNSRPSEFVAAFLETLKFAAGSSRPSEFVAGFLKTLQFADGNPRLPEFVANFLETLQFAAGNSRLLATRDARCGGSEERRSVLVGTHHSSSDGQTVLKKNCHEVTLSIMIFLQNL